MRESFGNLIKSLPINLYKKSSLDTVLSVYLFNAGEYVSDAFYEIYLKFARLFRNCYYDHGQEIFDIFDKGHGENKLIRTFSSD